MESIWLFFWHDIRRQASLFLTSWIVVKPPSPTFLPNREALTSLKAWKAMARCQNLPCLGWLLPYSSLWFVSRFCFSGPVLHWTKPNSCLFGSWQVFQEALALWLLWLRGRKDLKRANSSGSRKPSLWFQKEHDSSMTLKPMKVVDQWRCWICWLTTKRIHMNQNGVHVDMPARRHRPSPPKVKWKLSESHLAELPSEWWCEKGLRSWNFGKVWSY